jgi:hypothetical protein
MEGEDDMDRAMLHEMGVGEHWRQEGARQGPGGERGGVQPGPHGGRGRGPDRGRGFGDPGRHGFPGGGRGPPPPPPPRQRGASGAEHEPPRGGAPPPEDLTPEERQAREEVSWAGPPLLWAPHLPVEVWRGKRQDGCGQAREQGAYACPSSAQHQAPDVSAAAEQASAWLVACPPASPLQPALGPAGGAAAAHAGHPGSAAGAGGGEPAADRGAQAQAGGAAAEGEAGGNWAAMCLFSWCVCVWKSGKRGRGCNPRADLLCLGVVSGGRRRNEGA